MSDRQAVISRRGEAVPLQATAANECLGNPPRTERERFPAGPQVKEDDVSGARYYQSCKMERYVVKVVVDRRISV